MPISFAQKRPKHLLSKTPPHPTPPLVYVFFSTGGIVHQTLLALARTSASSPNPSKPYRAYLVGRSPTPANAIITQCTSIYPSSLITFIQAADLSLLRDIDSACQTIINLERNLNDSPRIDYLIFGQGGSIFLPRTDTTEGLDKTMSLMYYSRMRAITSLLPFLLSSTQTTGATVVSVYAAGMEKTLHSNDLSLRDPKHYSYSQARSHMCYMHTLYFEELARQNPGRLALIHIFPGLVIGPGFQNPELPSWFRIILNYIALPLFGRFITTKPEVCGQRMLSLGAGRFDAGGSGSTGAGTKAERDTVVGAVPSTDEGSGAYCLNDKCENNYSGKIYAGLDKDKLRERVWKHTNDAFAVIGGGGVFKD